MRRLAGHATLAASLCMAGLLAPAQMAPLLAARASETAVTLTGDDIRRAFEGNTVSGRYGNGGFFTEYHQADGKALGHNGYAPNVDACWAIVADSVCYYYGPLERRTAHCFTVMRNDRLYVLRVVGSSRINAVATIEPGNPRGHDDNGKPWVCDGLRLPRAIAEPARSRTMTALAETLAALAACRICHDAPRFRPRCHMNRGR